MKDDKIIKWLLEGDDSIQYQVHRDLLNSEQREGFMDGTVLLQRGKENI